MPQPPLLLYDPSNWYWTIGGDTSQVWSSAKCMLVPASDPDYQAWRHVVTVTHDMATMADIEDTLRESYPAGTLRTYTTFKRYQTEQGGITLSSGMPIATDDRAQAKINGVMMAANADTITAPFKPPGGGGPAFTTKWHAADGTIWPMDALAINQMSSELQTHINECFAASAATLDAIAAGAVTTRQQIDQAFAGITTAKTRARP